MCTVKQSVCIPFHLVFDTTSYGFSILISWYHEIFLLYLPNTSALSFHDMMKCYPLPVLLACTNNFHPRPLMKKHPGLQRIVRLIFPYAVKVF